MADNGASVHSRLSAGGGLCATYARFKYKTVNDTVAVASSPADARFVNGLKPGQFSVIINRVPYASWMPTAKAPATVLGVPVK